MIELNGKSLISARINLGLYGAWTADVGHLDERNADEGERATLTFGSQTFVGTVYRVNDNADTEFDTRIIGGNGHLSDLLSTAHHREATARNALELAVSEAGEAVSSTSDLSTLASTNLKHWARTKRTLGQELDAIARASGMSWRVIPDGSIWMGAETWQDATVGDWQELERDADTGRLKIASDDPTILPGQVLDGFRVVNVTHSCTSEETRTTLYSGATDRLSGALNALIGGNDRDLRAFYEYQVISQSGTNLELKALDDRAPSLSSIVYTPGIPGATFTVPSGTRCLVGFEGGDEQQPYIKAWVSGTPVNVAFPVSGVLSLGADPGAQFVALANLVDARVTAIQSKLDSFIATYNVHTHLDPVSGITGTPSGTTTALGAQATVACTKVKAT